MFIPSPEQEKIFEWAQAHYSKQGRKALAVSALAGTGKTTTILELVKRLPSTNGGIYCAFNKSIVTEVQPKLAGTSVMPKTFHGMGYGALLNYLKSKYSIKQFSMRETKYRELAARFLGKAEWLHEYASQMGVFFDDILNPATKLLSELVRFTQLKLMEWDDTDSLMSLIQLQQLDSREEFGWEQYEAFCKLVEPILSEGEVLAQQGVIDFTDMIYWNVHWNLSLPKYSLVLVDEAQDLSPMQREMVKRSLADNAMTVIIGDPNQSIYAFAGADSDSWELTVKMFNADVLPLSVTRRCAKIIAHHAANIVPTFTYHESAPRGQIIWLDEERLNQTAKAGDLVVCRIKAPLVGACMKLLGAGKPATILGSEIGKGLIALAQKIAKRKGFTWSAFKAFVEAYCLEQVKRFMDKGDEQKAQAIADECEALIFLYEEKLPSNLDALTNYIDSLFADQSKAGAVVLATGHKSKGLEAERVFVLQPERVRLFFKNQTPAQAVQEQNLEYVMLTRAKRTLVYLTNDKFRANETMPQYAQTDFNERTWAMEVPERAPVQKTLPMPEPVVEKALAIRPIEWHMTYEPPPLSPIGETSVPSKQSKHETPVDYGKNTAEPQSISNPPANNTGIEGVIQQLSDTQIQNLLQLLSAELERRKTALSSTTP